MIKLQWKDLSKEPVGMALRKCYQFTEYSDSQVSYRMGRIVQKIQEEMNKMRMAWTELVRKHCKMDDKGEPIMGPRGEFQYLDAKHEAEYKKLQEELNLTNIEIKVWPIPMKELTPVRLSPDEITGISFLIADAPDVEKDPANVIEPMPNIMPILGRKRDKKGVK